MQKILFLSRVAFICNCFFVIAVSLRFSNWISNPDLQSTVAQLGLVMAIPINVVLQLTLLVLLLIGKRPGRHIPLWLLAGNVLFLMLQVFYFIYVNR